MDNAQSKMENAQSELDTDTVWRSKRAKIDAKNAGNARIVFFNCADPQTARIEVSAYSKLNFMVKESIYIWPFDAVDYCKRVWLKNIP